METEKKLPRRKNLRWDQFDYNTPGAYFITICTHKRKCTLSHIVGAIHESPEVALTEFGEIVDRIINHLPEHLKVYVDQYIIMPNHIHMIMAIIEDEDLRAIRESPLRGRSIISKAVGYIKMNASKKIHSRFSHTDIWQRGFYDHIVRDQRDYDEIFNYILKNPIYWKQDKLYTDQ